MAEQNNIQSRFNAQDDLTPAVRAIQQALTQLATQGAQTSQVLSQLGTSTQQIAQTQMANVRSTQALAASYLALAQATQQQTQAYTQAQAAALAFAQQQAAANAATRQAGIEAQQHAAIVRETVQVLERAFVAGTTAALAFGVAAVKAFASLEVSAAKVGTQILGFNAEQLTGLEQRIREVAVTFGQETGKVGKALFDLQSANFSLDDSLKILQSTGKLAIAGFVDIDTATKAVVTVMKAYSLGTADAEKVTAGLFRAEQQVREDLEGLARAIPKLLPLAAAARVDFRDLGATLGTLTQQGILVNRATTELERALISLLAPAPQAKEAMEALGISLKRFKDGTTDLLSTFAQFQGLPVDVLQKIIPRVEGLRAVQALSEHLGELKTNIESARTSGDQLNESYEQVRKILTQAFKEISAAAVGFSTTLGELITRNPAVLQGLQAIRGILIALTASLRDSNSALGQFVGLVGKVLAYQAQGFTGLQQRLTGELQTNEAIADSGAKIAAMEARKGRYTALEDKVGGVFGAKPFQQLIDEERQRYDALIIQSNQFRIARENALKAPAIPGATTGAIVSPPTGAPRVTLDDLDATLDAQAGAARRGRGASRAAAAAVRAARAQERATNRAEDADVREEVKDTRDREQALTQLRAMASATQLLTQARQEDIAALLVAKTAVDGKASAEALELEQLILKAARIRDNITLTREEAARTEAQGLAYYKAATALQRYEEQLGLSGGRKITPEARTVTEAERSLGALKGTPLEEDAARIVTTLRGVAAQAEPGAKRLAAIYREVGQNIEESLSGAFFTAFEKGVFSGQQFGISLLQGLQQTFQQLSKQLVTSILNAATGATGEQGGGWLGALAGVAVKALGSYFGGGSSVAADAGGQAAIGYGFAQGGIVPALASMNRYSKTFAGLQPLALAEGGIVKQPSYALLGERPGKFEAVIPLSGNRAVPVEFTGQSQSVPRQEAPIIINLSQDFSGTIDPRALRTTPSEIIQVVARDVANDGVSRRVIIQHTR